MLGSFFFGRLKEDEASQEEFPEDHIVRDISYIRGYEPKQQLDIYLPPDDGAGKAKPVVVHFHGGGWVAGDRRIGMFGAPHMAAAYANAGIVAVAPSYRLGGLTRHGNPHAHIDDCVSAVQWVLQNINQYGGDPNQVFVSGHSAVGTLAALLGVSDAPRIRKRIPEGAIKGVVAMSGVYKLKDMFEGSWLHAWHEYVPQRWIEQAMGQDPVVLHENSPCSILGLLTTEMGTYTNDEQKRLASAEHVLARPSKNIPPFVLINAYNDLGLDVCAKRFRGLLAQHNVMAKHHVVGFLETNHANMNWTKATHSHATSFIHQVAGMLESEGVHDEQLPCSRVVDSTDCCTYGRFC